MHRCCLAPDEVDEDDDDEGGDDTAAVIGAERLGGEPLGREGGAGVRPTLLGAAGILAGGLGVNT